MLLGEPDVETSDKGSMSKSNDSQDKITSKDNKMSSFKSTNADEKLRFIYVIGKNGKMKKAKKKMKN